MNFFQSVFSDDPDPPTPQAEPEPEPQNPNPKPTIPSISSAWTFGSTLIKTLASKSESVIQTYRHDLEEFSSGIKKETSVIREAAAKAVHNLPTSLEAGASLAQESLESVGQAIDDLGSTVSEIISHGKESILAADYDDSSDTDISHVTYDKRIGSGSGGGLRDLKPYSRLDAQIRTVQSDMNTYLKDPEDAVEYEEWKLGFRLDEKLGEIGDVMKENDGVVGEIYREIVPERVDKELFWVRYFYRVHKIKMAEEARVRIVKRAISGEGDEELSWDVDEDDYVENAEGDLKVDEKERVESSVKEDEVLEKKDVEKVCLSETKNEEQNVSEGGNLENKSDMKAVSDGKTDKDSDISVVSSQPSPDEDGWDELEDVGNSDENKDKVVSHGSQGSADRAELRKRLSVAEEEEDLTWDIEDDDETVNG